MVGLATKVWGHAKLAAATTEAVAKLTAYGVPVDVDALDIGDPRIGADEPAFDVFWAAALERTPVVFDYRRAGREPMTRHLQPWGVVRFSGRWYAVGWDTDRDDERIFRLSRVVGAARLDGVRAATPSRPAPTSARSPNGSRRRPRPRPPGVLVRPGAGTVLRRQASGVETGVIGPDGEIWDRLELPPGTWMIDELIALGPDLVVEAPAPVRDEVVRRLLAVTWGGAS